MMMYPETNLGIFVRLKYDLKRSGSLICNLPEKLQSNKKVILLALPRYKEAVRYIKEEDLKDEEFIKAICLTNIEAFFDISSKVEITDKDFKYSLLKNESNFFTFLKKMEVLNIGYSDSLCKEYFQSNFYVYDALRYWLVAFDKNIKNLKNISELLDIENKENYSLWLYLASEFVDEECYEYISSKLTVQNLEKLNVTTSNFFGMKFVIYFFREHAKESIEELVNIFCKWCGYEVFTKLEYSKKTYIVNQILDVVANEPSLVDKVAYSISLVSHNEEEDYSYISLFKKYINNEKCPMLNEWYFNLLEKVRKKVTNVEKLAIKKERCCS